MLDLIKVEVSPKLVISRRTQINTFFLKELENSIYWSSYYPKINCTELLETEQIVFETFFE